VVSLLLYLGEVSYSLYMTHTLAQKILNRLMRTTRFVQAPLATRVLVLSVYAAMAVLLCLLTYYLVERPCRDWGRHRLLGQSSRAALPARLGTSES
jgi:peptidoglycan/LPS O-acetylase OafA/YrhL